MLQNILLGLAILIAGLLLFAASRPASFRIERRATMKAPADRIFAQLTDFHAWAAWSPWEKMEPGMQRTYSGAASGVGAAYAWAGAKVGSGRMEIMDMTPSSRLTIKLDFLKPFEAHNTTIFTLTPGGDGVSVTWAMEGANRLIGKVMGIFMSLDKMIGKDFEAGLANMKALVEK